MCDQGDEKSRKMSHRKFAEPGKRTGELLQKKISKANEEKFNLKDTESEESVLKKAALSVSKYEGPR